jgi:hypothetical protein
MTWKARATVTEVVDDDPVRVTAVADVDSPPVRPWGPDGPQVPTIASNTEGRITDVTLTLLIEGDAAPVRVGDVISIQGHFDATPAPAAAPE